MVNRIGFVPQKKNDHNGFYTDRKAKKQDFQGSLWILIRCMFSRDMAFWIFHILRTLAKNQRGKFAVSSFVGFLTEENIHESESTLTLLPKASKLYMYIHNIQLHIFSIKLISPVIAVYIQTVLPILLNCPTIPYKNLGGYPWKKIEKNMHESRLLCCNLYIVSPII